MRFYNILNDVYVENHPIYGSMRLANCWDELTAKAIVAGLELLSAQMAEERQDIEWLGGQINHQMRHGLLPKLPR